VVILLCRLLPLELLVPLIARTPLLDLGIQSAYATAVIGDSELRQLIAAPARRPTASWALRGMSIGMALRPRQATAAALLARMQQPLLVLWGEADRLVPIEVSRQLVRYKSDLELTLLEGWALPPRRSPSRVQPAAASLAEPPEGRNVIWPQDSGPQRALHEAHPFRAG